jgi:hypothetical protein
LGTYAGERPRVCVSARAQVRPGRQCLDPVLVCAGKRSAAQPWRWHNADNMCTTRDKNRVSGEVHTTKVCAHTTPGPRKAGPSLDSGVLSVWVPTASRNSTCARRDKINTMPSEERARCGRQRHLQTTGSARWPALKRRRVCAAARCGTAGNTQTASSQGSVQPRLEGRVHNMVGGFSPRVPGHDGEAAVKGSTSSGTAWSRGNRAARSMAFSATSSRCCSPAPWRSGEAVLKSSVKRKQKGAASFLVVPAPASRRQQLPRTAMETRLQALSQG